MKEHEQGRGQGGFCMCGGLGAHHHVVVKSVAHNHTLMFQSKEQGRAGVACSVTDPLLWFGFLSVSGLLWGAKNKLAAQS